MKKTTTQFNQLVQEISDKDKIGNLFIVDVTFDKVNADEKKLMVNEIYTPIFEIKENNFTRC